MAAAPTLQIGSTYISPCLHASAHVSHASQPRGGEPAALGGSSPVDTENLDDSSGVTAGNHRKHFSL